jgi:ferredoxin
MRRRAKQVDSAVQWLWLAVVQVFCAGTWVAVEQYNYLNVYVVYAIGVLVVYLVCRSFPLIMETSIIPILWLLIGGNHDPLILLLPFVVSLLVIAGWQMKSRLAKEMVMVFGIFWFFGAITAVRNFGFTEYIFLGVSFLSLLVYVPSISNTSVLRKKIDIIMCSYSSNTAHYTGLFADGLQKARVQAKVHRFHYFDKFTANLDGDALVLAFPVIGWKPPWPFFDYLWKNLPRGNGKPAFILYTAGGGPENAGAIVWLLLLLKGYRVKGRNWGVYPMNVVTFRIGPAFLWKYLDNSVPVKNDGDKIRQIALEFVRGYNTGLPFILWPSPLFIIGTLLDNRYLNMLIYRNYVWRRRCNGCGTCVKSCPAERLYMKDGFPAAKGTCALCMGCINQCPQNAMHLLFWSEYGQQYKSRWPDLLVRKQE